MTAFRFMLELTLFFTQIVRSLKKSDRTGLVDNNSPLRYDVLAYCLHNKHRVASDQKMTINQ